MWDLIVSIPDHCLSFYFSSITALGPAERHSPAPYNNKFNGIYCKVTGVKVTGPSPLLTTQKGRMYFLRAKGAVRIIVFPCYQRIPSGNSRQDGTSAG